MRYNSDLRRTSAGSRLSGRSLGTWVALLGAVGGAALISSSLHPQVSGARSGLEAPATETPVAVAPTAAPLLAFNNPADASVDMEQAMALREFSQAPPDLQGDSRQVASFQEYQPESDRSGELKEIAVINQCGNVSLHRSRSGRGSFILAGKRVAAAEYGRARQYSRQLHYELKRDGSKITIRISKPEKTPSDIYFASTDCLIFTRPGVKVSMTSPDGG